MREYNASDSIGPGVKDEVHLASVAAERSRQRITVGPAGQQNPMGLMNQHYIIPEPSFSLKPAVIEMITFRTQNSNRFVLGAFKDLRLSLWKLEDWPDIRWGTDNENAGWFTRISLFIGMCSVPSRYLGDRKNC